MNLRFKLRKLGTFGSNCSSIAFVSTFRNQHHRDQPFFLAQPGRHRRLARCHAGRRQRRPRRRFIRDPRWASTKVHRQLISFLGRKRSDTSSFPPARLEDIRTQRCRAKAGIGDAPPHRRWTAPVIYKTPFRSPDQSCRRRRENRTHPRTNVIHPAGPSAAQPPAGNPA